MNNKNIKILLVDDEPDVLEIVGYHLNKEGYKVFKASNGKEAVSNAKVIDPHLILLDIMMPEMDGIEACEKIRGLDGLENVLIVFFTARNEDYSQVAGFEAGADDYITKPIKPKVLLSKIKGLLRRLKKIDSNKNQILSFDGITINKHQYFVEINGERITLPRKEFELLCLLASVPNKVFNREIILKTVWGHDVIVGSRTIDVHIRKLREKIGDAFIKTIKGVGYKFVVD
ncbi:MAG: response regulator transcription factor [Flavobacteriaceae bacterium]|nr:response regulator transcription factor [Flavobacteriaceae bacterium]